MLKIIIFIIASAGLVCLSWKSLRNPHYHGFYRFFAFEFLLILVLLNADPWFHHPLSGLQIASWLLLLSSLLLAIHGFYLIRTAGKPKNGFDNTTTMIVHGAYKYIRHPLYSTLLLGGGGVFLKNPSPLGGILFLLVYAAVFATAKAEESENLKKFADYASYMKTTKMFIPFLF
jgi:protein-S-isoprenylcysteine O-methyltransferase Ste14